MIGTLLVALVVACAPLPFLAGSLSTFGQLAQAPNVTRTWEWLGPLYYWSPVNSTHIVNGTMTLTTKEFYYELSPISMNYNCTVNCLISGFTMNLRVTGIWATARSQRLGGKALCECEETFAEPLEFTNVESASFAGTAELNPSYDSPFAPSLGGVVCWFEGTVETANITWGGAFVGPGLSTQFTFIELSTHPQRWFQIVAGATIVAVAILLIYVMIRRIRRMSPYEAATILTAKVTNTSLTSRQA